MSKSWKLTLKSVWKHPLFKKNCCFLIFCFVHFSKLNIDIVSCTTLVKGFSDLLFVYDLIWTCIQTKLYTFNLNKFCEKNFFSPLFWWIWPQNCFSLPIKVFVFSYICQIFHYKWPFANIQGIPESCYEFSYNLKTLFSYSNRPLKRWIW